MPRPISFFSFLPLCGLIACNVAEPPGPTGGTDLPPGACGRGVVVVNTDYQSTNVSLVSVDGQVLSSSFISSASGDVGLSTPLGGDVVLPTEPQASNAIILLDRYPASVLTWVDVASGSPSGQLSVATGFAANPRDVLVLSPNKAYVTRYEPNRDSGRQSFDQGDDVLIIDPAAHTIEGRIDLGPAMDGTDGTYWARPDKLIRAGDRVFLLLGSYSGDYLTSAPSRIATLDPSTDSLAGVTVLDGMHGCSMMALSPSGTELAVGCSGEFGGDSVSSLAESGIVLLSTDGELLERRRFPAAKFGTGPIAAIAYASDTRLVFTTFGHFEHDGLPERQDSFLQVDADSGEFEVVLHSDGLPFSLGDIRCAPPCGVCFLADASRGVLHRFSVGADGALNERVEVVVDRDIGLPPRSLGWF